MNVGIISPGKIANKMAKTILATPGFTAYSVASRNIEHAKEFQNKYGFKHIYDDIEEMLKDPNLDLVYIASPHSIHLEHMELCLKYKKHVLCEKALTTSLNDTKAIYKKFEDANLYLCEALWASFLPHNKILNDLLYNEKIIGDVLNVEASFIINNYSVPRIASRELGGGAAMDLGVYPISFVFRTLGYDYASFEVVKNEKINGVDVDDEIIFYYPNGVIGRAKCSCIKEDFHPSVVVGTNGKIVLDSVMFVENITVYNTKDEIIKEIHIDNPIGGFEYELKETGEMIKQNRIESISWTHDNSIKVAEVVEELIQ